MYILPKSTSNDISYFGTLINEFKEGKIEEVKFKATRVPLGVYEQRKDGTYMVRIRCTGGFITPDQLKRVTEIAHNHGSELIHITTRQEIQIQNLQLKDTQLVMEALQAIGLSSKGGGGNTVRNILASIDTGICNDELFDVTPYVFDITTKLIDEPDSYTLPRKFKLAFSNTEADTGMAKFNDLGFIAMIRNGERGFNVYLGGSLGNKPMVGYELFDFAPVSDMLYIAKAAKSFFSQYGNRKNKHAARLRYVFYKMGKDEVFRLFFEIYNDLKKSEDLTYTPGNYSFKYQTPVIDSVADSSEAFTVWKDRYVTNQKQPGLCSVIVPFEHGNTGNEVLANIAAFASLFGDDVIRFSVRQNVHLRNIPDAYLGNLYQLLQANAIETSKPLLLNTLVSCTGADTCRLGICLSKGACSALKKQLAVSSIDLEKVSGLRINISGCPNSCGQQIAADLGFFGKVGRNDRMYPAYHVVVGARIGKDAKLADILGEISAHDLPKFTIDVIAKYLEKTDRFSSFELYANAEGKDEITKLLANYASVPHFSDNKNYYFDWSSEEIFSLATRGVGECSAGLFDMIDVDLATIQKSIKTLETSTNDGEKNMLLSIIVYAASRMLLITRGEEPKTMKDVYNAFIEKFIDDNLIDLKYRDLIENARDHSLNDFNSRKVLILELAQAVIALYEGMDDSLQFKNIKGIYESTQKPLPITEDSFIQIIKDFRGVACPMNFVKTKVALSFIKIGERLEVLLDDGAPIQNVPGSLRSEGHKVIEEKRVGEHWSVIVEKC